MQTLALNSPDDPQLPGSLRLAATLCGNFRDRFHSSLWSRTAVLLQGPSAA